MFIEAGAKSEVSYVGSLFFAVVFPPARTHVDYAMLRAMALKQLSDVEVIETADHLLKCSRCMANYRLVRRAVR